VLLEICGILPESFSLSRPFKVKRIPQHSRNNHLKLISLRHVPKRRWWKKAHVQFQLWTVAIRAPLTTLSERNCLARITTASGPKWSTRAALAITSLKREMRSEIWSWERPTPSGPDWPARRTADGSPDAPTYTAVVSVWPWDVFNVQYLQTSLHSISPNPTPLFVWMFSFAQAWVMGQLWWVVWTARL